MDISENSEPLPGYRLKRFLGRGGFGEAWEAEAPGKIPVAIKFIRLDESLSESDQRELEILRTIRHPHLLDIQFAQEVDGCLLLGMPLCDQDLLARLRTCQAQGHPGIPAAELLELMEETAKALDFLHGQDVIHRDIKPHNIFLVGGGAKVADFGLAKVLNKTLVSQSGHKFTPAYVAPEVVRGKAAKASDQYSLAISYCQLRTGRLPIEADDVMALVFAQVEEPPNLAGYDPQEAQILERALAKNPEQRFSTCRDFVKALQHALVGNPTPTTSWNSAFVLPPSTPETSPPKPLPEEIGSTSPTQSLSDSPDTQHVPLSNNWPASPTAESTTHADGNRKPVETNPNLRTLILQLTCYALFVIVAMWYGYISMYSSSPELAPVSGTVKFNSKPLNRTDPGLAPVSGTVKFDGKPLKKGNIIFVSPNNRPAIGFIEDGKIVDITTFYPGDGVPVGSHKIKVFALEDASESIKTDTSQPTPTRKIHTGTGISLIPQKYNDSEQSGLTAEIKASKENIVTLELSSREK